jgi:hypothetical protein
VAFCSISGIALLWGFCSSSTSSSTLVCLVDLLPFLLSFVLAYHVQHGVWSSKKKEE